MEKELNKALDALEEEVRKLPKAGAKGKRLLTKTSILPTANHNEATILARILCDGGGGLSPRIARHFLKLTISDRDKARMHDLAVRNQDGTLCDAEQQELLAYAKAGTLLSILKSRARRVVHFKPEKKP